MLISNNFLDSVRTLLTSTETRLPFLYECPLKLKSDPISLSFSFITNEAFSQKQWKIQVRLLLLISLANGYQYKFESHNLFDSCTNFNKFFATLALAYFTYFLHLHLKRLAYILNNLMLFESRFVENGKLIICIATLFAITVKN